MVSWGNEYVRNLAAEIGAEFHHRQEAEEDTQQLLDLVTQIVPYHMSHNAGGLLPDERVCRPHSGWPEGSV